MTDFLSCKITPGFLPAFEYCDTAGPSLGKVRFTVYEAYFYFAVQVLWSYSQTCPSTAVSYGCSVGGEEMGHTQKKIFSRSSNHMPGFPSCLP